MSWQSTAAESAQWPRIDIVRSAIQANRVSFPVPVPVFARQFRPDIQWRLAGLYFIHGWTCHQLAQRYRVTPHRIRQSLNAWVAHATAQGYLQRIPPENAWPVEFQRAVEGSSSHG
jgi:hypothetical protein